MDLEQNTQTQSQTPKETNRSHPSSASLTKSLSVVSASKIIEQAERRIAALEAELDRIKEVATCDLQSAHNDLMGKNREIARLRKELADFRDEQPEAGEVRDLLILWKARLNKNGRTDIGSGGKRWKIAQAALKRWGQARCEQAIVGLSMMPWAGPGGRAAQEYPGSKRYDDVEHALGDEVRMEKLVAVAKMYERPTLLDEPVGPVATALPEPVRVVGPQEAPGFTDPPPGLLMLNPSRGRPKGYFDGGWRDSTPPITKVLASLHDRGCKVIAYPSKPDSWSAQCPAHEDRSPSLSIHRKHDGMVLVHCFGGCHMEDVIHSLGLEVRDLWDGNERDHDRADAGLKRIVPQHLRHAMRELLALDEKDVA